MSDRVWLIQDKKGRIRAVGTGDRTSPYAPLGGKLDKRRDKGGRTRVSRDTFSTPEDARLAAALVARSIELVTDKAATVVGGDDDADGALVRGLPTRRKALHYRDLHHALVVRVAWDDLVVDDRLVHGRRHPKVAADLVATSWKLNRVADDDLDVRRLVVVTTAEVDPPRVLGIWKVDHVDTWVDHGGGDWTIGLRKRRKGDRGGHVGRRFDWDGYRPGSFGYSHDLRVEAGLASPVDEDADD